MTTHASQDGERSRAEPRPRRVIENSRSGERIVISQDAQDTAGDLLAFDLFLPPRGQVPARHVHPNQEERFTVVEGRMRFRLGRRVVVAERGDTIVIPAGRTHWFGNAGSGVTHALVEVRPALRTEEMLLSSEAMSHGPTLLGTGVPRLGNLAAFLFEFRHEVAIPDVPPALARLIIGPVTRVVAWRRARRSRRPRD